MKTYSIDFTKQLKSGARRQQKQLFEECYAAMFRVCNRFISRVDEAEDCLLKGFMKVFQQAHSFEYLNEQSLFFWIKKIMINESLMVLRKRQLLYVSTDENIPEISIDADVLIRMDAEHLHEMIGQLPEGYRTVFLLYAVEGYTHKEIAHMLSVSENTSKSQLAKAKARLRTLLNQEGELQHESYRR